MNIFLIKLLLLLPHEPNSIDCSATRKFSKDFMSFDTIGHALRYDAVSNSAPSSVDTKLMARSLVLKRPESSSSGMS